MRATTRLDVTSHVLYSHLPRAVEPQKMSRQRRRRAFALRSVIGLHATAWIRRAEPRAVSRLGSQLEQRTPVRRACRGPSHAS